MIASDDCIRRSELIMHLSDWAFSEAPLQDNHDQNIVYDTIQTCIQAVERMPSADMIERKRGKWVKNEGRVGWHCSNCGVDNNFAYSWNNDTGRDEFQDNFCPHCGADMREES